MAVYQDHVCLPSMGEGVMEATIIKWLVAKGQKVEKDEAVVQVSTDKVDTEIMATHSGFVVAFFHKEGDTVTVDTSLLQISASQDAPVVSPSDMNVKASSPKGGGSSSPSPLARKPQPRNSMTETPGLTDSLKSYAGPVRSSPLVRRLAREHGISLHQVVGTGYLGRVTRDDFFSHLATYSKESSENSTTTKKEASGFLSPLHRQETVKKGDEEYLEGVLVRREKMSKMRRLTAEHMVRSVQISPHVTTTIEVDLWGVLAHKDRWSSSYKEKNKGKLTLTPYFIQAAVEALKEYPICNASVDGDEILYKDSINIGCAVSTDEGLIVPVIKDAGGLSLYETATSLNTLVERARSRALKPGDVVGGTFSITNPGMLGSLHAQPIINQPQVAIMSVGCITSRPHVVDGNIEIRPLCQIGLTFDHRVIDGEGGLKFLSVVKESLRSFSPSS